MAIAQARSQFSAFNLDPALAEAVESAPARQVIEGIIRLEDPQQVPPQFTVVSRFKRVLTGRFAAADAWAIRRHPNVLSLKAARPIGVHDEDAHASFPVETAHTQSPRRASGRFTGRGCILAALDFGLDFGHPNFVNEDGTTRLVAFWHQGAAYDPAHPNRFGYGRFYSPKEINAALRSDDPYRTLGFHPSISDTGSGSHGTNTTDLAAGNGRAKGARPGAASGADLIFVHLATPRLGSEGDLGDSVRLLEGLDAVSHLAGRRSWVVNLSVGRTAGSHDGTSPVEQGMQELLRMGLNRAICQSAGNYQSADLAVEGWLRDGEFRDLEWIIDPKDKTANEIDAWYSGKDRFIVGIRPPGGSRFIEARLGEVTDITEDGQRVGRIYHRKDDPNNRDNHIEVFLYPEARPGQWTVRLFGDYVISGRFHAWIERDLARPGAQSRFARRITTRSYTLGTIATSPLVITVGAYDAHAKGKRLAHFSSCGPTRDERHDKPELLAPGVDELCARSIPRGAARQEGLLVARSGTSMAAPHVAGAVCAMLEAARRPVSIDEIRDCLKNSAEPVSDSARPDCCAWGRLNAAEAIRTMHDLTKHHRHPAQQSPNEGGFARMNRNDRYDANPSQHLTIDPDSEERESDRMEAVEAFEAESDVRPLQVRARILWPALGFPAVISPRANGSTDALEARPSRSIVALIVSNQRFLGKEDVAHYLRIVPWSERGRRHIPDGQPGSFGVDDVQVRNDDRGKLLRWPQSDTHGQAVVFGGGVGHGQHPDGDPVVVSLSRMVLDFYRKQGLEHLHEIRVSEAAAARLKGDQYHLFWNDDTNDLTAPSGEMRLLLDNFAKPNRADLAPEWRQHLPFFLDEYKYDYGALHMPYQSVDPQKRLTEVLHPVFIRRWSKPLNVAHMTDTHVDVRADVYEENLASKNKLAGISFNNYNRNFCEIYRDTKAGADVILMTGDLIDYGRGHVGLFLPGRYRETLGQDGAYHRDRNWMLFYYLLASDGNYSKPVYTCLGNHDWRLNPYPPFAPGTPDPESLVHNADDFWNRPGVLKDLIKVAHGPGHERGFAYTLSAESELGLLFKSPMAALRGLGNKMDTDGSPVQTKVESVAWYLMLINPFLDYSVRLPGGQQVLLLDWAEDEEVMNFDEPRSFMEFGQRAAKSLTPLQQWQVEEFARMPGKAKIIGVHAPPIGPYFLWEDSDLLKGEKKYARSDNSLLYDANWKRVRMTEHTLFAIRPKTAPRGVEAAYGSFNQQRDWFIRRVADPAAGIRLVLSGHIHRNGLLVVRTPRSEPKAWIIRGVDQNRARGEPPPRVGRSEPDAGGQSIGYFGPLYVNTTSAGPRGHRYQGGHRYVSPGYAIITLASDGTIANVSVRQIVPAKPSPVRRPVTWCKPEPVPAQLAVPQPSGAAMKQQAQESWDEGAFADSEAADRFLDRAELALESSQGGRAESETGFLQRLLGELGGQVSRPGPSPAGLFKDLLSRRSLRQGSRDGLDILAMPAERPETRLRKGDLMLRAVPGSGDVGHVAVLASDDLVAQPMLAASGLSAEGERAGYYGSVIEAGAYPRSRARPFARRWLDRRGRVPPHTMVLRPRLPVPPAPPDAPPDEPPDEPEESGPTTTIDPFPAPYALPLNLTDAAFNACADAAASDPDVAKLCGALVDLTGKPPKPLYRGQHHNDMLYVGSLAKIYPMYAAYELMRRVEAQAKKMIKAGLSTSAAGWQNRIFAEIKKQWQPKLDAAFPPPLPSGFPRLADILQIMPNGDVHLSERSPPLTDAEIDTIGEFGAPKGKFRDWLRLVLRWSNNAAASKCILALSYPYMNGVLGAGGFFDKATKNGLWISGDYMGHDWLPGGRAGMPLTPRWAKLQKRPVTNFAGTSCQVARLLTLIAQGKLVDGYSSTDMIAIMQGDKGIGSYIGAALANATPQRPVNSLSSKIGYGNDRFSHDCAIIRVDRGGDPAKALRLVTVILGSPPDQARTDLDKLAVAHYDCVKSLPAHALASPKSGAPKATVGESEEGESAESEYWNARIIPEASSEWPLEEAADLDSSDFAEGGPGAGRVEEEFDEGDWGETEFGATEVVGESGDGDWADDELGAAEAEEDFEDLDPGEDEPNLKQLIDGGLHDANELTNRLFFARHPELPQTPLDPNLANFKQLSQEWSTINQNEVWPAIEFSAANADLVVSGQEVSDHHRRFFQGKSGQRLKKLVENAAKEADLNPGLLGTVMMAETRRPQSYLSSAKASSYHVGTDDFYEGRFAIEERVPAYAKVKWDKKQKPFEHLNDAKKPRMIKTILFDSGPDAVLATAVYLKFREVRLREIAAESGGNFDALPLAVRIALTRIAMGAGTGGATPYLKRALKGEDIFVRKDIPVKAYQTQRNATVRTAQAMHLSDWVFGIQVPRAMKPTTPAPTTPAPTTPKPTAPKPAEAVEDSDFTEAEEENENSDFTEGEIEDSYFTEADEAPPQTPALICPPQAEPIQRTVYGWSQYKRRAEELPPDQRAQLSDIGNLIKASFTPGCTPVARVEVNGHADHDTPRNLKRERQYSEERAQAAADWLKSNVGPMVAERIEWQAKGLGASELKAPPTSELNRRQNRRVEVAAHFGPTSASGKEKQRLTVEVVGLAATSAIPSWKVIDVATKEMIAQETARSMSFPVALDTPIDITMSVPRPPELPPAGEWLRIEQRVVLKGPDGSVVPLAAGSTAPDSRTLAPAGESAADPAEPLHPLVTLQRANEQEAVEQARSPQKVEFHAEFIDVSKDVVGTDEIPSAAEYEKDLNDECEVAGVQFRIFQETSRSCNDLWAVAYHEPTLNESRLIHCLLHLRHRGEWSHAKKCGEGTPRDLNLNEGGLGAQWPCHSDRMGPFFIRLCDTGIDQQGKRFCKLAPNPQVPMLVFDMPAAGFIRQLVRAGKPIFLATPLTDSNKTGSWLGLERKDGFPRERMQELARTVRYSLSVKKRARTRQMRLALVGWSRGARGAIRVLDAHRNDIDELYWSDPPKGVVDQSRRTLQAWLSQPGPRGPRFLRLLGGTENASFFNLRDDLAKHHVKGDNQVTAMVPRRFWETSSAYRLAISVPPPSTLAGGPFPESISCAGASSSVDCATDDTALSTDTGVFLSKITKSGVEIIGKDQAGKQPERPMQTRLGLAELKGLLRFSFHSPIVNKHNIGSQEPLYRKNGFTVAKLKREFERITIGTDKFNDTSRHRWAIAGGMYPETGTPAVPTAGPSFHGFLQMCLMQGRFPSK